jgi:hypothetical protein
MMISTLEFYCMVLAASVGVENAGTHTCEFLTELSKTDGMAIMTMCMHSVT